METPFYLTIFSTLITSLIGIVVKRIYEKMEERERQRQEEKEKERQEQEDLRVGLCSMLRNSILHSCMKYISHGCKPMYEINNIGSMYDSYHRLGGNGSVTRMYKLFVELPTCEEQGNEHKE